MKSKKKEHYCFLKNGAKVLEEILTSFNGNCNPIRAFSKKELILATKSFREDQILDQGWGYEMYKGTHDDRSISVKKFNYPPIDSDTVDLITNEIAVASNMSNHKNFLKLLGCCLESEVPMLVYEFPENGNLSDHIFLGERQQLVSWESRLRIATEVANAIAYLHKGTAKVIIHRDIKPRNIWLDQDYVAKLSEFRFSIAIPIGEDHVNVNPSEVAGTRGFIAPEAFCRTSKFTERSDVYGFGFVLSEIFTGKKWLETLLASPFLSSGRSSSSNSDELIKTCSSNINELETSGAEIYEYELMESHLKTNILAGNKGQLLKCAELILRCIKVNPEERPTMMEVAQTLRSIKRLQDLM